MGALAYRWVDGELVRQETDQSAYFKAKQLQLEEKAELALRFERLEREAAAIREAEKDIILQEMQIEETWRDKWETSAEFNEARMAVLLRSGWTRMDRLMKTTCRVFGVTMQDLRSARKTREVVFARAFLCYWAHRLTPMSAPQIGRKLGGRDHTTVLHARDRYPALRAKRRAA